MGYAPDVKAQYEVHPGAVVQERAGETNGLAVAVDVHVVAEDRRLIVHNLIERV